MTIEILFDNNASALLAVGIVPAGLVLSVDPGDGALFPSPGADEYAVLAIEDDTGQLEYVHLTSRAVDDLTVTRAQEGTAALTFALGARVELRLTKGTLGFLVQKDAVVNQIRGPLGTDVPIIWAGNQPQIGGDDIAVLGDIPPTTAYSLTLLAAASAAAARTVLGSTSVGDAVFTALNATTARTALGAGATGDVLFTTATSAAALTALGAGVLGGFVFGAAADYPAGGAYNLTPQKFSWDGGELSLGADTDHDISVAPFFGADVGNAYAFRQATAIVKQLDAIWATGTAAGGLATPDEFTADTGISFDNAGSTIDDDDLLGTKFAGLLPNDQFIIRGSGTNNLTFTVTTVAANSIGVTPAPTTEASGASVSGRAIYANYNYAVHAVDDGAGGVEVGYDDSEVAANLLALTGGTYYRKLGYIYTNSLANIDQLWDSVYPDVQRFYQTGTYVKPDWATIVNARLFGGAGSGAVIAAGGGGGGGGSYNEATYLAVDLAATVAVAVAAGGASVASGSGLDGGDTSFGGVSGLIAYGGAGGRTSQAGGGGGGTISAGSQEDGGGPKGGAWVTGQHGEDSAFGGGAGGDDNRNGGNSGWGGAGGGGSDDNGGYSVMGGGGGGGGDNVAPGGNGGLSQFAGNGGDGDQVNGVDGGFPSGGGGGCASGVTGSGADGFAEIISW